jgi:hypothetical protein
MDVLTFSLVVKPKTHAEARTRYSPEVVSNVNVGNEFGLDGFTGRPQLTTAAGGLRDSCLLLRNLTYVTRISRIT